MMLMEFAVGATPPKVDARLASPQAMGSASRHEGTMNAPAMSYHFAPTPETAFAELDLVRFRADMATDEGDAVPAGTRGTVVAVWGDGSAYEVEVAAGLVTATAAQLVAA